MNLVASTTPTYITRDRRSWKQFDVDKFRADLQLSALLDMSIIAAAADTDDCAATHSNLVALYDKTLTDLLDRHAPVTTKTVRRRPRTDPWFDDDCRKAKRAARRLERRYKRHRSEFSHSVWLQALRRAHNVADEKRADFWKRKISEQTNVRQAWKVIDSVLCREKTKVNDESLTAVDFATFFERKISGIRASTDGAAAPTFSDNISTARLLSFEPIDISDTVKLIREAPMKQCAVDPIPTWLLKDCIDLLAPFITKIINNSLSTGYVPAAFKKAYITPLLKKPGLDEGEASNFRPVSNLSVLSKTLERAVSRQLERYLSSAGLFPSHQSAYRKHHSTETVLLRVCSDIITHLDKGEFALMAFLDLSAAFDTVDRDILLERLSRTFGIQGNALEWFRSYLTDRMEHVLCNGVESPVRTVMFGVPQGSVLGPLLFLLYTADLEIIAQQFGVEAHLYADDSQMYVFNSPHAMKSADERLLRCLDEIARWMQSNRLSLNPSKTQFMRCATTRRLTQLSSSPITFCGQQIWPVSSVRNLGVTVDSSLSFCTHVNRVVSSCFYQLRRIKSSLKALPLETAKTLVNCFVVSRLDYCNSLLAGVPQTTLDRLQRVMNTAARMLCGVGRREHVSDLLSNCLHWLRVPQRVQFKLCLLMYKSLHGMAPTYLAELCQSVGMVDARGRLRSAERGDLITPRSATKFGDRAFAISGPQAWNGLPTNVRNSMTLSTFKAALKTHLFI